MEGYSNVILCAMLLLTSNSDSALAGQVGSNDGLMTCVCPTSTAEPNLTVGTVPTTTSQPREINTGSPSDTPASCECEVTDAMTVLLAISSSEETAVTPTRVDNESSTEAGKTLTGGADGSSTTASGTTTTTTTTTTPPTTTTDSGQPDKTKPPQYENKNLTVSSNLNNLEYPTTTTDDEVPSDIESLMMFLFEGSHGLLTATASTSIAQNKQRRKRDVRNFDATVNLTFYLSKNAEIEDFFTTFLTSESILLDLLNNATLRNQKKINVSAPGFADKIRKLMTQITEHTASPCDYVLDICPPCYTCGYYRDGMTLHFSCNVSCDYDRHKTCIVNENPGNDWKTSCSCQDSYLSVRSSCVHRNVIIGWTSAVVGTVLLCLLIMVTVLCCWRSKDNKMNRNSIREMGPRLTDLRLPDLLANQSHANRSTYLESVHAWARRNVGVVETVEQARIETGHAATANEFSLNCDYDHEVSFDVSASNSDLEAFRKFQPRLDKVDSTKNCRIKRPTLQHPTHVSEPVRAEGITE